MSNTARVTSGTVITLFHSVAGIKHLKSSQNLMDRSGSCGECLFRMYNFDLSTITNQNDLERSSRSLADKNSQQLPKKCPFEVADVHKFEGDTNRKFCPCRSGHQAKGGGICQQEVYSSI